jgi:hypothetical protein
MGTPGLRRVGVALAALACASPAPTRVEMCAPPPERPPRASASCFEEPEAHRHAGRVGSLIGETLSGWRSHPGTAELGVAFGEDGRVASVCFDSVAGGVVARRIPDLAHRLRELPAAPACLAGRRLDFAWESEVATSEDVRRVVRHCRREVRPLERRIDWCRFRQHCSVTELTALESDADRELRSCVLASVPLAMRTGVSREVLAFRPTRGRKPDPELALRAHRVCDRLPRPADVIECMDRHGWEPAE